MDLKDAGTSKNTQIRRSKTQILDIKCCGADRARVGPIPACHEQKGSNLLIQIFEEENQNNLFIQISEEENQSDL